MPKNSPPVISNVQVSPTSGPGGTVFSALVTASEFPSLRISYQWKLDGADIVGAIGAGLIASGAGQLTVLATATNEFGSDSRESAAVLVSAALAAPAVTEARIVPGAGVVGDRFAVIAEATGVPAPELSGSSSNLRIILNQYASTLPSPSNTVKRLPPDSGHRGRSYAYVLGGEPAGWGRGAPDARGANLSGRDRDRRHASFSSGNRP
jgi:hypothetical protein